MDFVKNSMNVERLRLEVTGKTVLNMDFMKNIANTSTQFS